VTHPSSDWMNYSNEMNRDGPRH